MLALAMGKNAGLLAAFALLATGSVVAIHLATKDEIAHQERASLEAKLQELIPAGRYDNRLYADCTRVRDEELLGTRAPVTVYRARLRGEPVAAILSPVAPDGYSGSIRLLVGVNTDGRLAGVRVTAHKETPGLGDKIETRKSGWILSFDGKSLDKPPLEGWAVKPDGGEFDAFTGATITPRAVVKAVSLALEYFGKHRDEIFAAPNQCQE